MLQKTQSTISIKKAKQSVSRRLNAGEKGLLQFAVIDDGDTVLQISCSGGALLREMLRKHHCQVCGTTGDMAALRVARQSLPDADIIYAQPDDIPWRDESFSILLCNVDFGQIEDPARLLKEAMRVLKPGGQMLMTLTWYPSPISHMLNYFSRQEGFENSNHCYSKQEAIATLEVMGFESVTWHTNEFGSSVVIGWKPKYQYA
jgi:Methylase involved in ubiquinone/menaquinone biosynthesis